MGLGGFQGLGVLRVGGRFLGRGVGFQDGMELRNYSFHGSGFRACSNSW